MTVTYTQKCQQACFILHPYVAMGTAQGSQMEEDRQHADCCADSRSCSLQGPQSKRERPRADKDTKKLEGLCNLQNRNPLGDQCLCTQVLVARGIVGKA